MTVDLYARSRFWAIHLTERPSVTGTEDEASFGPWLAEELQSNPVFGSAEIWTIPVAKGDPRHCVAMFLRGTGPQTVLLTGHFDTVTTQDYGDLRDLAIKPVELLRALRLRLDQTAQTPAEILAKADFSGDDFLPGRGLLDMKAGLAAGLAVAEQFAATSAPRGNLLFIAVPDEENASAGARAAAQRLADIAADRQISIVAAINLDAIADNGDGSAGRAIATGTVGKVLPTAFVVGVPTHSGFPLNGINAAVILAAIVAQVEWSADLTDSFSGQKGTPPSLLSLRDGKSGYDVTTPASAFATWNVIFYRRTPAEILTAFDSLCQTAIADVLDRLGARAGDGIGLPSVPIIRFSEVLECAKRLEPAILVRLADQADASLPLPERCRRATETVWAASGLAGPAVVTGFGSIPYLSAALTESDQGGALKHALQAAAKFAGAPVAVSDYFAGISDMSFFGEADPASLSIVAANTPLWETAVCWPDANLPAGIPTINIGPWGRDYHTPLERMHVGYAFDVLPKLLNDVVSRVVSA